MIRRVRDTGLGSARVSRVGDGVLAVADFFKAWSRGRVQPKLEFQAREKFVAARRRNQHARRVRYSDNLRE